MVFISKQFTLRFMQLISFVLISYLGSGQEYYPDSVFITSELNNYSTYGTINVHVKNTHQRNIHFFKCDDSPIGLYLIKKMINNNWITDSVFFGCSAMGPSGYINIYEPEEEKNHSLDMYFEESGQYQLCFNYFFYQANYSSDTGRCVACSNTITVEESLNINTYHAIENVSIYPNPATNQLYINGTSTGDEFTIKDYSGRIIEYLQFQNANENKVINVNTLPSGMYLLEINRNQNYINKRFIKH